MEAQKDGKNVLTLRLLKYPENHLQHTFIQNGTFIEKNHVNVFSF